MKLISINIDEAYLKAIEELIDAKRFPNRSEAIRQFIRDGIVKEMGMIEKKKRSE